jgi:ferredoxin-NADP reductase
VTDGGAPLRWRVGELVDKSAETSEAATLVFDVDGWPPHRAGQHVDLRLTAEDGYQAQRSYSIASAPDGGRVALTVARLDDGEVSPYLVDEMAPGDVLELRGPLGGWFTWQPADGGPLLLVAGGSGVVPLMAMLRHRAAAGSDVPVRLLLSARTDADVIYADELRALAERDDGLEVFITLTREAPPDWSGGRGRLDGETLRALAWPAERRPLAFVCGPTAFVEAVADGLAALGHEPGRIRTERFGATGGG